MSTAAHRSLRGTGRHVFPIECEPWRQREAVVEKPKKAAPAPKPQPAAQKPVADPLAFQGDPRPRIRTKQGRTPEQVQAALASNEPTIDMTSAVNTYGLEYRPLLSAIEQGELVAAEIDPRTGRVLFKVSDIETLSQKLKERS